MPRHCDGAISEGVGKDGGGVGVARWRGGVREDRFFHDDRACPAQDPELRSASLTAPSAYQHNFSYVLARCCWCGFCFFCTHPFAAPLTPFFRIQICCSIRNRGSCVCSTDCARFDAAGRANVYAIMNRENLFFGMQHLPILPTSYSMFATAGC